MQTITKILDNRQQLVFESGTGSGKTICALSATLEFALENNKKIIFTTRTNAQQRQVILELRQIREKNKKIKDQIFAVGMQGRTNTCILARKNPDFNKGTSEELSKFCANEKRKAKLNNKDHNGSCIYYRNFLNKEKINSAIEWFRKNLPTAEEFIDYCEKNKSCPYEINKFLIKKSRIVVVPYIYVFDSIIRNMLFDCLSVPEGDMILVVDEAHNLPNYIRDLFSVQLSTYILNSCVFEAKKYGNPSMAGGLFLVSDFCNALNDIIRDLRDTYVYGILENGIRENLLKNNDAFIPSHEFESEILFRLKITSKTLHDVVGDLIAYGEKIREYRQKNSKLPRSYLYKLGLFLDSWINLEMNKHAKLVVDMDDGKNPHVEAFCLDPSIGTEIIRFFHSSIHMSGTLEPLEEYRDSMGLSSDRTELVSYSSPFSKENRKVLFVRDVTTKYDEILKDEKIFSKMKKHITNICNIFPKNTMVFFPSFNVMSIFRKDLDFNNVGRCLFVEEKEMSQSMLMDLVSEFKEHGNKGENGATLFSVIGGRISEGMDFPAEQLEIAVIVGIPYPKPTARQRGLQRYYDMKFRKGWEYTVEAPTARKLLQSIGRLIRDEKDKGVAVILDRRATRFKRYIPDLTESKNIKEDISRFINE
ncbi:MAG: ATP-dependent DNA helicase [Thermoplasmatales archaeon]|nr:MAG: ATP-dependent DNA helicase [Thermoplasmatales archaeon]